MNPPTHTGARHLLVQLGWLNAGCYALDRLLSRIGWRLYKYDFVAQPVAAGPLAQGRGAAYAVRLAGDAGAVPAEHPRPRRVIAQRYAQGAQSLQAWDGERLAGFLWWLPAGYQEDEVRARYLLASAQSVWDFDVYVAPAYRLGPVFRRLWEETHRLLRARGVRWTCSRISAFNAGSRQAHARLGAVRLGGALFLCCGRWQWMAASRAPYLHLSRDAASFPQLLFDTSALEPSATPEPPCPVSTK